MGSEKVIQKQVAGSKSSLVGITYYFIFVIINCIEFTYPCTESTYISSESHMSIPVAFPLPSLVDACLSRVSQKTLCYLLKTQTGLSSLLVITLNSLCTWECAWPIQKLFHMFHYLCQPLIGFT